MPYIRERFLGDLEPLADVVELSSATIAELRDDMRTKYDGLAAIYHFRDPGSPFGFLGEDFMAALPGTCKAICHRAYSRLTYSQKPA